MRHQGALHMCQFLEVGSWVTWFVLIKEKNNFYWRSLNFESKSSSREFFQKTNKWIHFYYYGTWFRSYFGRNWSQQKDIFKSSDLQKLNKFTKWQTTFTQNDDLFPTWTILSEKSQFAQLVTEIIFVSAWDRSHDSLANSQELRQM